MWTLENEREEDIIQWRQRQPDTWAGIRCEVCRYFKVSFCNVSTSVLKAADIADKASWESLTLTSVQLSDTIIWHFVEDLEFCSSSTTSSWDPPLPFCRLIKLGTASAFLFSGIPQLWMSLILCIIKDRYNGFCFSKQTLTDTLSNTENHGEDIWHVPQITFYGCSRNRSIFFYYLNTCKKNCKYYNNKNLSIYFCSYFYDSVINSITLSGKIFLWNQPKISHWISKYKPTRKKWVI